MLHLTLNNFLVSIFVLLVFFFSVGHCQVDLGVHQNKTSQNSSWTEIFYRIYEVGKYLRRSLGSPLCLKLGQGWTQTSFQRVLCRQSLEISKDESSTTFLGHVYLKKTPDVTGGKTRNWLETINQWMSLIKIQEIKLRFMTWEIHRHITYNPNKCLEDSVSVYIKIRKCITYRIAW